MDWASSARGGESIPIITEVETQSVPFKTKVEAHQTGESVPIETEAETDHIGETVPIKPEIETNWTRELIPIQTKVETDQTRETEKDQMVDTIQHHNMCRRECHFMPPASTTEEISLRGTTRSHPADLEWQTVWLQTAPIKFEADFYQPGCVARGSVMYGTDLNQTSPTHSDDRETGDVFVKTEPHDIHTNTPLSIKQEAKCFGALDAEDKPEHTVHPVGLYQNIHATAHLAQNVHGPVTSEKCDVSDGDTCPRTCGIGVQNTSDCPPSEKIVGHSSKVRASIDRDVSKGTLDTHRMAQSGEKASVCKRYDTVVTRHIRTRTGDKSYQCKKCDASFVKSGDLKHHMQTHGGDKPFICNQCGVAFTWSCYLKRHMQSHTDYRPYVCEQCDATFTCSSSLNKHVSIHTGKRPYVCKQCNAAFRLSANLKSHVQTHTGKKPYLCQLCDAAFARSSGLKRHEQVHIRGRYVCKLCKAIFPGSTRLKYHTLSCTLKNDMNLYQNVHATAHLAENVHTPVMPERFVASDGDTCDIAVQNTSERSSSKSSIGQNSHQQTSTSTDRDGTLDLDTHRMAQDSEKPGVCKQHDTVVTSLRSLKLHAQTNRDNKPYMCAQCGAAFRRSSYLKCHMRTHTGIKPFICKQCGNAFSQASNLKYHIRTHTGDKPYSCKLCGAAFSHSGTLKKHTRTHTGDKPYVCKLCEAAFSESTKLKYHIRTHTGDRPYLCQCCGASFAYPNTFKNHMQTHTDDKPYVCTLCDAAFTQSRYLKRHIDTIHTKKQ